MGSPPTGTSTMTLISLGGFLPIEMASMRMGLPFRDAVVAISCHEKAPRAIRLLSVAGPRDGRRQFKRLYERRREELSDAGIRQPPGGMGRIVAVQGLWRATGLF